MEHSNYTVQCSPRALEFVAFHRHVVVPGADVSGEDASVQTVANAVHTAEVIAAYRAAEAARE